MKIKIRIFGAKECKNCQKIADGLKAHGISYDFVDAKASNTQSFCDKHGVNTLPHIQILGDDNTMIHEHVGYLDPTIIKAIIEQN
tara:strand:- start:796 stop:1050 length:255 start_codon:yes stop_codon:yes gene_type:complete